jgi:GWxTD domain-containing protein
VGYLPLLTGLRSRKKYILALVLLLVGGTSALAQPRQLADRSAERFFAHDILFFKTEQAEPDSIRTDVFVAIPYDNLSFLNAGDRYVADYGVVIQVIDAQTEKLVLDRYQEHSVTESVSMREKRTELEQGKKNATQYSFKLGAEQTYDVRISLRDLTAKVTSDTTIAIRTPRFSGQAALSSPMLYRSRRGAQVLPNIGNDVSILNRDDAGVFVEAYNAPNGNYLLAQFVYAKDDESEAITPVFTEVRIDGASRTPIFQSFDPTELWLGEYELSLHLLPSNFDTSRISFSSLKKGALASTSRVIKSPVQSGIPFSDRDLDIAIEQLEYIATPWEWDSLHMGETRKAKRLAVIDFWRKRDPYPGDNLNQPMEVFYKRVAYANFHYGGESDRGRVYIVLGEPTFVERQPYQATSKPYEMWEYADLNVRYFFVDHYLLGEYRLTGAPPRQGLFLWERGAF